MTGVEMTLQQWEAALRDCPDEELPLLRAALADWLRERGQDDWAERVLGSVVLTHEFFGLDPLYYLEIYSKIHSLEVWRGDTLRTPSSVDLLGSATLKVSSERGAGRSLEISLPHGKPSQSARCKLKAPVLVVVEGDLVGRLTVRVRVRRGHQPFQNTRCWNFAKERRALLGGLLFDMRGFDMRGKV